MMRLVRGLAPSMPRPKLTEMARSGLGAGLGLLIAGLVMQYFAAPRSPVLIAPFGATAFLIFAVPNSPLAQPWAVVVGCCVSALMGVLAVHLVPSQLGAAGLAVAGAVVLMGTLRAMHPPAGAVALLEVLMADPSALPGPSVALFPVATGCILLVGLGILWNRLTGRVYPFRQPPAQSPQGTADAAPDRRMGLLPDDLQAILDRLRLSPNLGAEDLGRALEAAEAEATARHLGGYTARDVMSRDLITLPPKMPASEVAELFQRHRFKTLPVRGANGALIGLVEDRSLMMGTDVDKTAADLAIQTHTLPPDAGLADLLSLIADGHQQSVPIVEDGRLIGLITRSDLIALLARNTRMEARS